MITPVSLRYLSTLADCRAVVGIQEAVWGRDGETVPASVLFVSAKRGGVLIGAFEQAGADAAPRLEDLVGFVWSLPGIREPGERTHWSHMLGVLPLFRGAGVGERLKWAQRERVLAQGVELVEWTFDPLQAANAHFNLNVLGAVGASYGVDVYGSLAGPLHRGTPTDRLIVDWAIGSPHVDRRRRARAGDPDLAVRSADVASAPILIRTTPVAEWVAVAAVEPRFDTRRVSVPVPPRFSEMQQQATDLAMAWRLAAREVMTAAFDAGYRAVDFLRDREAGSGRYVFARSE